MCPDLKPLKQNDIEKIFRMCLGMKEDTMSKTILVISSSPRKGSN